MDERSGTVRLVESRPDAEARGLVATVSRSEAEEALRANAGPLDLLLDVERVAPDGEGRETERIALAWEPEDLEQLLAGTSGDELSLAFDEDELRRLLDEDVEAHGMREKLAVISVVAGMAAAGAGAAGAAIAPDGGGSSSATAPAAAATQVTPSEISTGLVGESPATPSEVSTGVVQEPPATPAEVTTGIVQRPAGEPVGASKPWSPSPEETALVAGMILALTAVGFAVRAHRRPPATA